MANMSLKEWKNVNDNTPLRVAFYGRVSTEHEMQVSAFENQIEWYKDIAKKNPNWTVVAPIRTYLDRGITGTDAEMRQGFMNIIADAKRDKFDMIVTRDVSRFCRNIVDSLQYCRMLKKFGVQIFFVGENIRSIQDKDAEFKLEVMSMLAENYSRDISEKVKAGQFIARQKGVLYGTGNILGYERVKFRREEQSSDMPTFRIVEEEAETVRMIYRLYLSGLGLKKIKNELEKERRKTATGLMSWDVSTISRVLDNPMYMGKQYQCQTTVEEFLSHERKKNSKEDFILIDGDFAPIIDEDTFNKVKALRQKKGAANPFKGEKGATFTNDKWSSKLECDCGSTFKRFQWNPKADGTIPIGYSCRKKVNDGSLAFRQKNGMDIADACDSKSIPEWHLELAGKTVFSSLITDKRAAVLENYAIIERCYCESRKIAASDSAAAMKAISKNEAKIRRLLDLYTEGDIEIAEYREKRASYEAAITQAKAQLQAEAEYDAEDEKDDTLIRAFETLAGIVNMSDGKVNNLLMKHYVDKVVVRPYGFDFMINLKGDATEFAVSQAEVRKNEPYAVRAARTNKMLEEQYQPAFISVLDFETARKYRKDAGDYLRTNQWDDKVVKVFIRK